MGDASSLPGEDRDWGGNILYVDLIPQTAWFTNARSALSTGEWKDLAKRIRARAGNACETCGWRGWRRALDVHERWAYVEEDGRRIQRLKRLIALCTRCHSATHMGYAEIRGVGPQMLAHLARVNHWTIERAREHRDKAFAKWEERSTHLWDLDLGMLEAAGYHPREATNGEQREAVAEEASEAEVQVLNILAGLLVDERVHDDAMLRIAMENLPPVGQGRVFGKEPRSTRGFVISNDVQKDATTISKAADPESTHVLAILNVPANEAGGSNVVVAIPFMRLPANVAGRPAICLGPVLFKAQIASETLPSSDADYVRWHGRFARLALATRALLEDQDLRIGLATTERMLEVAGVPPAAAAEEFTLDPTPLGAYARFRVALERLTAST